MKKMNTVKSFDLIIGEDMVDIDYCGEYIKYTNKVKVTATFLSIFCLLISFIILIMTALSKTISVDALMGVFVFIDMFIILVYNVRKLEEKIMVIDKLSK